jgi:hypothetical protein
MDNIYKHQVVCFGEVLWDILPSGAVPAGPYECCLSLI